MAFLILKTFIWKYKIPIFLIVLSSFIIWPLLLPGFFRVQDYLQVMRIYEMRRCIEDLQIPCRWVAEMGSGYGFPLFNYYGVFPYYLAAAFSYLFGYIGAAKLIFFLPLIFGGLFMYILAKEVFNNKQAAFVSALLYLFAPYRALDIYVRGAISESIAMTLIILVFYYFLKLIRSPGRFNFLAAALSLAAFLLTHNLMTMLFSPLLVVWIIYWLYDRRKLSGFRKTSLIVLFSFILGFLLAASFILPAYFEQSLIQTKYLSESEFIPNFRAHFVTIKQLFFSRFWGYGISTWGENDGISFQIGWPHWQLVVIVTIFFIFQLISRKIRKNYLLYFIILVFLIASLLMTHNKSAFIWESIGKLEFVQFPWRFLSIAIFCVSFLGGAIVLFINKRYSVYVVLIITLLTILLNYRYFRPENFQYNLSDKELLTGSTWEFYQQGSLTDYLPSDAMKPTRIAPLAPIINGKATVINFKKSSNKFSFQAVIMKTAVIDIPIFDYSNWQIFANGLPIGHSSKGEFGTIQIVLDQGNYLVSGSLENTTLRVFANSLSVVALGLTLIIALRKKSFFQ